MSYPKLWVTQSFQVNKTILSSLAILYSVGNQFKLNFKTNSLLYSMESVQKLNQSVFYFCQCAHCLHKWSFMCVHDSVKLNMCAHVVWFWTDCGQVRGPCIRKPFQESKNCSSKLPALEYPQLLVFPKTIC